MAGKVLLLDLDGVIIFEARPPFVERREILRLHDTVDAAIAKLGFPVVVLTHRSRAEARVVTASGGLSAGSMAKLIAADDLFFEGCRRGRFLQLARQGLQKSLALSLIEREFGVVRSHMAIIDDRMHNVTDLLDHGVGLALHAPSRIDVEHRQLVSFDLADALADVGRWTPGDGGQRLIDLPEISRAVAPWQRTGLDTEKDARHVFNLARRAGFLARTCKLPSAAIRSRTN